MRLGLIGAFGHNDTGDEAMLVNVLARVKEQWGCDATVFSANPSRVVNHIGIRPEADFSKEIFGIMSDTRIGFLVDLLASPLTGHFDPWRSLLKGKLRRPLKSPILRRRALEFLDKLESASLDELIDGPGRRLRSIDALLMIGGGYINSHWSSRMYPQLLTVALAKRLGKPVVISGQTIGPIDGYDLQVIRRALASVDIIGVRDIGISRRILHDQIGYRGVVVEAPDNALFLQPSEEARYSELLKQLRIRRDRPYIVVNLRDNVPPGLEPALKGLTEDGYLVVALAMKPSDVGVLRRLERGVVGEVVLVPFGLPPSDIRALISHSQLVISQRHHPVVFALGEAVPAIGLYKNEYYHMKLMGTMQPFGMGEFCIDARENTGLIEFRTKLILERRQELNQKLRERIPAEREREERFWAAAYDVLIGGSIRTRSE